MRGEKNEKRKGSGYKSRSLLELTCWLWLGLERFDLPSRRALLSRRLWANFLQLAQEPYISLASLQKILGAVLWVYPLTWLAMSGVHLGLEPFLGIGCRNSGP